MPHIRLANALRASLIAQGGFERPNKTVYMGSTRDVDPDCLAESLMSDQHKITVIELPDRTAVPTYWNEECLGAWPAGSSDPVSAWPGSEVALPNGDFLSAAEARALGLALIAAANTAERCATDG